MTIPFLLIFIVGVILFFVAPQLAKLRATLGIPAAVSSDATTILQKIWLLTLGLKTPFLNTVTLAWSFILAEGDSLKGFAWEQFVSHEHAVWIAMSLWFASLWAHFTGINTAAATPPVIAPLPSAVPAQKA